MHAAPVVDLDISLVEIELVIPAIVHASREGVSSVARHVVRQHEHDVRIRDAKASDRVVHR